MKVKEVTGEAFRFPRLIRFLVTKHDGHVQSNEMEGIIRTLFGGTVLNKAMFMTDEITKSGGDMQTVYELDRHRGARSTYIRALDILNGVNEEIYQNCLRIWAQSAPAGESAAIAMSAAK
jgi:chromosome partitioning protein